ncbi:MAG: glycosyltransferase [Planctomycetota bacterium]
MIRLGFLFDRVYGWEQRIAARYLSEQLPTSRFATSIAGSKSLAHLGPTTLRRSTRRMIQFPGPRLLAALVGLPGIGTWAREDQFQIVHTWCVPSAFAASAASGGMASSVRHVILELYEPVLSAGERRLLRTLSQGGLLTVVCSTQTIRRRLIEYGIYPESTVVIRPGVDFGFIQQTRRTGLREELGLAKGDLAVLLPPSSSSDNDQLDAFVAVSILHFLHGPVRVILPQGLAGRDRIVRFSRTVPRPGSLIVPGHDVPVEQLISVADVLLVPTHDDGSTTAVAWAMAARMLVVGVASYALAELIAHKVNGLLFKHAIGKRMTAPIAGLLRGICHNRDSLAKLQEAARGQAYEVFSVRRYVDQHARLYENLLSGKEPGDGISDPAMVG